MAIAIVFSPITDSSFIVIVSKLDRVVSESDDVSRDVCISRGAVVVENVCGAVAPCGHDFLSLVRWIIRRLQFTTDIA